MIVGYRHSFNELCANISLSFLGVFGESFIFYNNRARNDRQPFISRTLGSYLVKLMYVGVTVNAGAVLFWENV